VGRTLQIDTPEAYEPFLHPARYKGAHGGRGSAKSHVFAELLVEKMVVNSGTRAVCVREVQRSLEQSVKRLLEDKIKAFQLGGSFRVMNTHIETPGDGIIIFQGMQNHTAESIKSLEGYDVAWVEEAQSLSERSLTLLRPTIRKEDSEIWFTWNPSLPTDPVDKLLRSKSTPPGTVVVGTTYRDNPWFPDVLRKEMEWDRSMDTEKYEHVWEGAYEQHSEARVFKNWRVAEFETPRDATFLTGGDWGFSVDPTVLVRCYEDRLASPRKRLYIDNECYQIGCEIDHTPALFDTMDNGRMREWRITADSARPETISYLQRHGYPRIVAAKKGQDSVKEGVIFLQGYDIVIHPRCKHTIDEFKMYSYKKDKLTGIVTPYLEDKKNHVIDSLRYAVEQLRGLPELVLA
jgi:phage terminase large subunit